VKRLIPVVSALFVVASRTYALGAAPLPSDGRSGEVRTVAGNQIAAEITGIDCSGLTVIYRGQTLHIALDRVAQATSNTRIVVRPAGGSDRLVGKISVVNGSVRIQTEDLGEVALPITALCRDPLPKRPASARASASQLSRKPEGDARDAAAQTNASSQADNQQETHPSAPQLSQIAGKGGAPDATAQTSPSSQTENQKQQQETQRNVLEFLRNEAVLVPPRKVEGDFSLSYLHTTQFLGNDKVLSLASTARVGITSGLESFLQIPFLWGQQQTNEASQQVSNEVTGIGDIKFGLKYSAVNEGPDVPNIVLGLSASAPTGRAPYVAPITTITTASGGLLSLFSSGTTPQIGDTRDPLNVEIGTGHWSVTGSTTALKSFDPLLLFATVNYTHYVPATYYGVYIEPGDLWELNTGLGFSVNETGTLSAQLFVDYENKWKFDGRAIPQTLATPESLRFAYTHILDPNNLLEPAVLFGITRDANDAIVSLDYIHRF
jgi:hypothetical protein